MIVDYSDIFGHLKNRDAVLARLVILPAEKQDWLEAKWAAARGQGQMVCDLAKKRQMEAANGRA